jgi:hypothetical protein
MKIINLLGYWLEFGERLEMACTLGEPAPTNGIMVKIPKST